MRSRERGLWENIDWITIGLFFVLILLGWLSIYSAGYNFDNTSIFDFSHRFGKQFVWISCALILGFVILLVDGEMFELLSYVIYAVVILLLIATLLFARDIKGSRSWLEFGSVRLQAAEFSKFATALVIATFMNRYNFNLLTTKNLLTTAAFILLPMGIIILQKETGSALTYFVFLLVLYREGLPGIFLLMAGAAIVIFVLTIKFGEQVIGFDTPLGVFLVLLFIIFLDFLLIYRTKGVSHKMNTWGVALLGVPLLLDFVLFYLEVPINLSYVLLASLVVTSIYFIFIFLKTRFSRWFVIASFISGCIFFMYSVDYIFNEVLQPHQQIRIQVLLGVKEDPSGAGYNVNQSKIAIGSGGLWGKGVFNGTQTKLKYVPEHDTDFIFCTIGEEFGFIGSVFVLFLFLVLILRLIYLAEQQHTTFGRVYGYSVAAIFFFHLAINVGMVIGLSPVIGIPLPFFSYGGSSLWSFTILLFIFLSINAENAKR